MPGLVFSYVEINDINNHVAQEAGGALQYVKQSYSTRRDTSSISFLECHEGTLLAPLTISCF